MKYRLKTLVIIALVIVILCSPTGDNTIPDARANEVSRTFTTSSGESWLTGWDYRKEHIITGSSGAGVDYQINIKVNYNYTQFVDIGVGQPIGWMLPPFAICYNDVTYFVFSSGSTIDPYATSYNHTADTWADIYKIADLTGDSDAHFLGAISVDANGYVHIFYGTHNSDIKHAKSDSPEDISAWTDQGDVVSATGATYPHPRQNESDTYLFYSNSLGVERRGISYKLSDDNGATWGSEITVVDFGAPYVLYFSGIELVGDLIHFAWGTWNYTVGYMNNIYYAYLDASDNLMYNVTGHSQGASIDVSEGKANCMVSYSDDKSVHIPAVHLDASDTPYLIWTQDTTDGYKIKFAEWSGSAWVLENITSTDHDTHWHDFIVHSSTNIEAYLTTSGLSGRGGDIEKWTWNGATWSKSMTVMTESSSTSPLQGPKIPLDYNTEIKVVFSQANYSTDWAYFSDLRIYAFNGTNFVSRGDNAENVGLEGKCQTDFDDIRFTDDDGETELDYWIESKHDSQDASFWIEVVDTLSSDATIYIYYGNSTVSTSSNGDNTFLFFDDFNDNSINTTKWVEVEKGTSNAVIEEVSQQLHLAGEHTVWSSANLKSNTFTVTNSFAMTARRRAEDFNHYRDSSFGYGDIEGRGGTDWAHTNFQYGYSAVAGGDTPVGALAYSTSTGYDGEITSYDTISAYGYWYMETLSYDENGYLTWTTSDGTRGPILNTTHLSDSKYIMYSQGEYLNGNGGETYLDYVFVRNYIGSEPIHFSWGNEESPNVPVNINAVLTNPDDTSYIYARRTYVFTVNVTHGDGYASIDYVNFSIITNADLMMWRFVYDESLDSFYVPDGDNDMGWDLDLWSEIIAGSCDATKSGNNLNLTFVVKAKWASNGGPLYDLRVLTMGEDTSSDSDRYDVDYDLEMDIDFTTYTLDDEIYDPDRGAPSSAVTASGAVTYSGSSITPPDDDYDIRIIQTDEFWNEQGLVGTDSTPSSGAFSVVITSESTIKERKYWFKPVDAGTNIDIGVSKHGRYYITDRTQVQSIIANDTHTNLDASVLLTVRLFYDYDNTDVINGTWSLQYGSTYLTLAHDYDSYWTVIDDSGGSIIQRIYNSVNGSDIVYGLGNVDSNGKSVTVTWNRLVIDIQADDEIPYNSQLVNFTLTVTYEYDSASCTTYVIQIARNATNWYVFTSGNLSLFAASYSSSLYYFNATSLGAGVTESTYGLTAFITNTEMVVWTDGADILFMSVSPTNPVTSDSIIVSALVSSGLTVTNVWIKAISVPDGFSDQYYSAAQIQDNLWTYNFSILITGYYAFKAIAFDGYRNSTLDANSIAVFVVRSSPFILSILSWDISWYSDYVTLSYTTNWANTTAKLYIDTIYDSEASEPNVLIYTLPTTPNSYNITFLIDGGADSISREYEYTVSAPEDFKLTTWDIDWQDFYVYITWATSWGNSTITPYEDDSPASGTIENYTLQYEKTTLAGNHTLDFKIDGGSGNILWKNYTYAIIESTTYGDIRFAFFDTANNWVPFETLNVNLTQEENTYILTSATATVLTSANITLEVFNKWGIIISNTTFDYTQFKSIDLLLYELIVDNMADHKVRLDISYEGYPNITIQLPPNFPRFLYLASANYTMIFTYYASVVNTDNIVDYALLTEYYVTYEYELIDGGYLEYTGIGLADIMANIDYTRVFTNDNIDIVDHNVLAIPYPPAQKTNLVTVDDFWVIVVSFGLFAVLFAVGGHGLKGAQIARKSKVFFQKPENKSSDEAYREG